MFKRIGVALVAVAYMLGLAFAPASADESCTGEVHTGFNLFVRGYYLTVPETVVNGVLSPGETVEYISTVSNDGSCPAITPVVTKHEWTSGSLYFGGWAQRGPGTWEYRGTGVDQFELLYVPPVGGLQPGMISSARVLYYTKCGEFAHLHGKGPNGSERQFNIGLEEVHENGTPEFGLGVDVRYEADEYGISHIPVGGEVLVTTAWCQTEIARLPGGFGYYFQPTPILVSGESYTVTFIPSESERVSRHLRWSEYVLGQISPNQESSSTFGMIGIIPTSETGASS